jgi:RNA polymerase sigma-70 factor (ECF subfamily)
VSSDVERRRRFEAIADEVYGSLQRYLRRRASPDEADDAFGDALLTIWRRLDQVPVDAALPWSYGVARRCLANRRRSARRHLRLVERLSSRQGTPPSNDPADDEERPELAAALRALPEAERELLTLWAWEQLEPREIAVVLDTTANAISLRLTRAKAKLAAELARQDAHRAGHGASEHTEEHRP